MKRLGHGADMDVIRAEKYANKLMEKFGVSKEFVFKMRGTKKVAAYCHWTSFFGDINLSIHFVRLAKWRDVKDVVLHEIAHAIRIRDCQDFDHSPEWRKLFQDIGGSGLSETERPW